MQGKFPRADQLGTVAAIEENTPEAAATAKAYDEVLDVGRSDLSVSFQCEARIPSGSVSNNEYINTGYVEYSLYPAANRQRSS